MINPRPTKGVNCNTPTQSGEFARYILISSSNRLRDNRRSQHFPSCWAVAYMTLSNRAAKAGPAIISSRRRYCTLSRPVPFHLRAIHHMHVYCVHPSIHPQSTLHSHATSQEPEQNSQMFPPSGLVSCNQQNQAQKSRTLADRPEEIEGRPDNLLHKKA